MASTSSDALCVEGLEALSQTTPLVQAMLARLSEAQGTPTTRFQDSFEELQTLYLEQNSRLKRAFENLQADEALPAADPAEDLSEVISRPDLHACGFQTECEDGSWQVLLKLRPLFELPSCRSVCMKFSKCAERPSNFWRVCK